MAQVFLRPQSNPTQEQAYQAVTLYFGEAFDNAQQSGFSLINQNIPDTNSTYHGLCFWINNLDFDAGGKHYYVISDVNEASPLTDTPILGDDLERVDPYGTADRFTVNFKDSAFEEVPFGIMPDDFYSLPYKYFVKDGLVYRALTRQAQFDPLAHYYRTKKTYKMQYNVVGTGIINFSFGFTTMFGEGPSGYGTVFSTPDDITYRTSWNSDSWNWGMPRISSARYNSFYGKGYGVSTTTPYNGPYVEVFPVAFSIPEGKTISGYGGDYTVPKTTQYYGAIIVQYDQYAIPKSAFVEALEEKCWASPLHPHGDYGPNTPAYGGKGKTPIARDNPRQSISKVKVGGILTNPSAGSGIVIYKMNETEFTDFIRKFSSKSLAGFGEGVGETSKFVFGDQLLTNFFSYMKKDAGNILFIKTSPVEFPHTNTINLGQMKVGSATLANITAQVVTDWYTGDSRTISLSNNSALGKYVRVNDFTDLEPYASAELYFPTASTLSIPPSYLANSQLTLDWGFNLLDSSSTVTATIETNINEDGTGGTVQLASTGQCCAKADTLIAERENLDATQSLAPLITKGLATVATGGMTAPDLVTTAAGAAMTAVPSSQQMSVTNIPSGGSSAPYNDCIVGGRRSAILTITKAQRLSSGEEGTGSGREQVQGKFSNFYVSTLNAIGADEFVSVLKVKMDMASGMTKAEYDKIIALLHEGVWI